MDATVAQAAAAQAAAAQAGAPAGAAATKEAASFASELVALLKDKVGLPGVVSVIIAKIVLVLGVVIATAIILRVLRWVITGVGLGLLEKHLGEKSRARAQTLVKLFYSVAKYVIYFFAFITALNMAGVDTTPFLAGAAVIGLAVSFGSQDLVKDVITGIFILLEDQFTIGEFVDLGAKSGKVAEMSIRMVTVRDAEGRLHNIPYRTITVVTNFSRTEVGLGVDVFVGGAEVEGKAPDILKRALKALASELPQAVKGFQVAGVINPGTPYALVRAKVKSAPEQTAFVQAQIALRAKRAFAAEAIEVTDDRIRFTPQE